jgi:regulator of RNase E activity RraA
VIRPGDLLHGDANGIVVVPPELVADLPSAIESIRQTEAERIGYIKGPDFDLDDLVKMLEGANSTY